jgi:hypothetical protein
MDSTLPNKHARLSLVSAIVTLLFFCIGFAPFLPMTAIVCYPAALLSGVVSLVSGLRGLRHSSGHWMAWVGIMTGILVILGVAAFTTLTALLLPVMAEGVVEMWQSLWP